MEEKLTGLILMQYLIEHFEVLHPFLKLYLANFSKQPLKYYKNLLALRTFLGNLRDANQKFKVVEEYKSLIQKTDYFNEVTEFYFDFVNMFKNNEARSQTAKQLYFTFPIKKNLFLLENKELFEKIRFNFYNQVK